MIFYLIILGLPVTHALWWWGTIRATRRRPEWRRRAWIVHLFAGLLAAAYVWIIGARFLASESTPPRALLAMTYIWYLLILPWAAPLAWLAAAIGRAGKRPEAAAAADAAASSPPISPAAPLARLSRRELLAGGLASAPIVLDGVGAAMSMSRLRAFRVRRLDVHLSSLPPELDGLTIAHLSDTHAGNLVDERMLGMIAETTNRLEPDLVLFTGDLIDFSLAHLPAGIGLLRRLNPRHGLFVCEGNHDLFDNRGEFEQRMKAANVGMLLNESVHVSIRGVPLQILGTRWTGRVRGATVTADNLGQTLALRDPAAFAILLAHHPHEFDRAAAAGVPLTLAGHTHGGQLMLSDTLGAGPALFRYWSGLYRRDAAALVVSNGAGNWFPLRINAPAEIIHATLHRETGPRG